MCVNRLNDFLQSSSMSSEINIDSGEIEVYYSAYSCDSSFEEKFNFKFCPYCGQSIKSIIEQYKYLEKKKEDDLIKKAKKEQDKLLKEQAEHAKAFAKIRMASMDKGTYSIFSYEGKEYKAISKNHLSEILGLKGVPHHRKKLIFLKKFINHKEVVEETPKKVKVSKKVSEPIIKKEVGNYDLNKSAKVGEKIKCCNCGNEFEKKQYSQVFCKISCKDHYWNKKK